MTYPATYRYTREHEWLSTDGKTGKVGITDYAQESLGDIVFVDLPKIGSSLEQGKVFGSVESVKAVSDLYSPVSGTVTEVNQDLATAPEKINTHPARILDSQSRALQSIRSGEAIERRRLREVRQ